MRHFEFVRDSKELNGTLLRYLTMPDPFFSTLPMAARPEGKQAEYILYILYPQGMRYEFFSTMLHVWFA